MSARNVDMDEADTELCQTGMRSVVRAMLCARLMRGHTISGAVGCFLAHGMAGAPMVWWLSLNETVLLSLAWPWGEE